MHTLIRALLLVLGLALPAHSHAQDPAGVLSGLWWNPNESGWGINLTQRRNVIFAAWFTYNAAGAPRWVTASDCRMPPPQCPTCVENLTCSGTLYETRGPRFLGVAFDPAEVTNTPVGDLSITFRGVSNATMTYNLAGQRRTVAIQRQSFSDDPMPPNAFSTDLWWNPAESGWGVATMEQRDSNFLVLFTYDGSGNPVWYFSSRCEQYASGDACRGPLYRATGPSFGPTFEPSRVSLTPVGDVSFSHMRDGAMLYYYVDGVTGTKRVYRQYF